MDSGRFASGYPIICRWGGKMITQQGGVDYEGGHAQIMMINISMSFSELVDKMCDVIEIDRILDKVKLLLRCLTYGTYFAIPLVNHHSMEAIWAYAAQTNSLEIYVEQTKPQSSTQGYHMDVPQSSTLAPSQPATNWNLGFYTSILSNDACMNDQVHLFSSPLQLESRENQSSSPRLLELQGHPSCSPRQLQSCEDQAFSPRQLKSQGHQSSSPPQLESHVQEGNLEKDGDCSDDSEAQFEIGVEDDDDDDNDVDVALNDMVATANEDLTLVNSSMTSHAQIEFSLDGEFMVGQKFNSKVDVLRMVKLWSIQRNYMFKTVESRPETVHWKCGREQNTHAREPCQWRLRASRQKDGTFMVTRYNGPHASTCVARVLESSHKKLDFYLIRDHVKHILAKDPSLSVRAIIEIVRKDFHCIVTYKKAWRAKQWALELIFGNWEKSYEDLPAYMQALQQYNLGTVVKFQSIPTVDPSVRIFKRVFWAFKPSIDGFKHCRPLLTIDGTHLYGKYKGTLLIANGTDATNKIFSLAFAAVESENGDSWSWFMMCIREYVTNRTGLCVISDRHAGIIKAMNDEEVGWAHPMATDRFCIRHVASNLCKEFRVKNLKPLFEHCAYQCQNRKFNAAFNSIGQLTLEGREYLSRVGLEKWALCHDGGNRYGLKTTNMVEAFNHVLKPTRSLPITALVRMTFNKLREWFAHRRRMSSRRLQDGFPYSPLVTTQIERNEEKASHHEVDVFHFERHHYQVKTGQGNRNGRKGVIIIQLT